MIICKLTFISPWLTCNSTNS